MANPFDFIGDAVSGVFGPPAQPAPTAGATGDNLERTLGVLQRLENAAGNPGQTVPSVSRSGRRQEALGLFGIMDFNLPAWSRAAVGREVSRDEFLADADLQRRIAGHRVGTMLQETGGDVRRVAAMWLGGPRGEANPAPDRFGTTATSYADRFMRLWNAGGVEPPTTTGALPGSRRVTGNRTMADDGNPFAAIGDIFGPPAALRVEREQQRGATERQGMVIGHARSEIERQRQDLQNANDAWRRIWTEMQTEAGVAGPVGPEALNTALRRFAMTPEFFLLGRESSTALVNVFRQLQQNPNAPFTVNPGQTVARDTPAGPERLFRTPGVGEVGGPPGPRQPGPLDQQRGAEIGRWSSGGRDAAEMLGQIAELERVMEDPRAFRGRLSQIGTWLGIPPQSTPAQVAAALNGRLVLTMQRLGADRQLSNADNTRLVQTAPNFGNSVEANRNILGIHRRNLERAITLGFLGDRALSANTPEAINEAFSIAANPVALRRVALEREALHLSEIGPGRRLDPAGLRANTAPELRQVREFLVSAYGNPLPPRVQRYIELLAENIEARTR